MCECGLLHPGTLFVLYQWSCAERAMESFIRTELEIDTQVWACCELIDVLYPLKFYAPCQVAGQCSIDIPISQHNRATLESRHNITLMNLGNIGGMEKTEQFWIAYALLST